MTTNEILKKVVKTIQSFDKEFPDYKISSGVNLIECTWTQSGKYISYNKNNIVEDLFGFLGETYTVKVCFTAHEDPDFLYVNCDNECGYNDMYLFLKENRISEKGQEAICQ